MQEPADANISLKSLWRCGSDKTNSHAKPSPGEEKGQHGHSLKGRAPWSASVTLSREKHPDPFLDRLLLLLGAHYIEDGPHTIHRFTLGGYLLQKTKESMLINT